MKNKEIGFEIAPLKEGERIITIPIGDDLKEYLKVQSGKNVHDYLKDFSLTEKNYNVFKSTIEKAMHDSLPESIKTYCPKCGENAIPGLKHGNCAPYIIQLQLTFYFAATEFVNIVLRNPHIQENKKKLLELTKNFFESLVFINGEGKMYFNLDRISRYCLNTGFENLAEIFSKSETLINLQIINDTLNDIEQVDLKNKVLQEEDENYLSLQKKFFKQKQRFYKEKLALDKENPDFKKPKLQNKQEMSIPQFALYYYYLQTKGYYPYFEHHDKGKLVAIKELLKNEGIKTTPKYFQIKYNFINNHITNRIAKNQAANISYVIAKLNDYTNAKELALSELKLAQLKNK